MASSRVFDDGSSQYLIRADRLGLTDYPFTFACWFKVDDASINQGLMAMDASGSNPYEMRLRDPADSDVIAYARTVYAKSSTQWSTGSWHHACAIFASDTSRIVFLDAAGKDENTTNVDFSNDADQFMIGQSRGLYYTSGKIALAAVWNIALSDADVAALWNGGAGALPPTVQGANLIAYWFDGTESDSDHKGSYDMTPVNGPTWDSGDWPIAAGGVSLSMPVAYYYRRRRRM